MVGSNLQRLKVGGNAAVVGRARGPGYPEQRVGGSRWTAGGRSKPQTGRWKLGGSQEIMPFFQPGSEQFAEQNDPQRPCNHGMRPGCRTWPQGLFLYARPLSRFVFEVPDLSGCSGENEGREGTGSRKSYGAKRARPFILRQRRCEGAFPPQAWSPTPSPLPLFSLPFQAMFCPSSCLFFFLPSHSPSF